MARPERAGTREAFPGRQWLAGALVLGHELRVEWREDRVGGLAAEVAFFGLLGLFPTLLVMAAALGSLDAIVGREVAARAEEQVLDFLHRVLTDEASGAIDAVRNLFWLYLMSPGVLVGGALNAVLTRRRGLKNRDRQQSRSG